MPRDVGAREIERYLEMGRRLTRRRLLASAAGVTALAASGLARAQELPDPPRAPGRGATEISAGRSPFEDATRRVALSYAGIPQQSNTDHSKLSGVITPSDLHFERHHAGVPTIDPGDYRLLIHGMVERPMVFTLEDLKRLPQVSHVHFVECAGNTMNHWGGVGEDATVLITHSRFGNSEWIGVPLEILLREVGVRTGAQWLLAESYDGAAMTRSVPLSKGYDDAMIAYGQNGEAVRPEQGYPARLLLPGWEGNINVKWLRRIEVGDRPFMSRQETAKYTPILPAEGLARQFGFEIDAKSVITQPSGGMALPGAGFVEIRGLAWSGRGKVASVEVSTDGGGSWVEASLQEPILPKSGTRFRLPWRWDGEETIILSRCIDDTGAVQATRNELLAARGRSTYHFSGIQAWRVRSDGQVRHVYHEEPLAAVPLPEELAGPWPSASDCGLA